MESRKENALFQFQERRKIDTLALPNWQCWSSTVLLWSSFEFRLARQIRVLLEFYFQTCHIVALPAVLASDRLYSNTWRLLPGRCSFLLLKDPPSFAPTALHLLVRSNIYPALRFVQPNFSWSRSCATRSKCTQLWTNAKRRFAIERTSSSSPTKKSDLAKHNGSPSPRHPGIRRTTNGSIDGSNWQAELARRR